MSIKKQEFLKYLGIDSSPVSHHERIISGLGGFIAIFLIFYTSSIFIGTEEAVYIIPSMGASAVLLFAVPHSPLGQLWNVFGGHCISALIGVICARYIPVYGIAVAASVGLAILAMYYARCIHPPGGATALAAVIGGPQIHALGFQYILTPVVVNTVVILVVAVLFNAAFEWRRYPAFLVYKEAKLSRTPVDRAPIDHADLVYALSQIDSFIDVTEEDLLRIYRLATVRTEGADTDSELKSP